MIAFLLISIKLKIRSNKWRSLCSLLQIVIVILTKIDLIMLKTLFCEFCAFFKSLQIFIKGCGNVFLRLYSLLILVVYGLAKIHFLDIL